MNAKETRIAHLFEEATKARVADREFWFLAGKESDAQPTWAGRSESTAQSMALAREDAWFYVGCVDLGDSPAATAVRALREGVNSRVYAILERRSALKGW
jgi:hypothetical protein